MAAIMHVAYSIEYSKWKSSLDIKRPHAVSTWGHVGLLVLMLLVWTKVSITLMLTSTFMSKKVMIYVYTYLVKLKYHGCNMNNEICYVLSYSVIQLSIHAFNCYYIAYEILKSNEACIGVVTYAVIWSLFIKKIIIDVHQKDYCPPSSQRSKLFANYYFRLVKYNLRFACWGCPIPANTLRNNNVFITSNRRHFDDVVLT